MSVPLTSLPIAVSIDYSLSTFTVSVLGGDITVTRSSLAQALDQLILALYKSHNDLKGKPDDQLTVGGQNWRDTKLEFGTP
jgi:hypothetical protein